ncbi:Smr/MutS family protein [Candidatus Latescibacterota bacterium]
MNNTNDRDIFFDALNNLPEDILSAKYNGCDTEKKNLSKKIRKNRFHETIDLHGLTKAEALNVLRNALIMARGKNQRILVITGKGNNSDGGYGVLRETVWNFLQKAGSLYVREFDFASRQNGGDGAIEILTK